MGRLFKIEMKKLRKSTAMKVMLIVALVRSLFNVGIYALLNVFTENIGELLGTISGYSMALMLSKDASDITLMVVILMAVLVGGDFSARTLQTQVAAGYSRLSIIASRYISIVIAYIVLYVLYVGVTVAGVTAVFGFGEGITSLMVKELLYNFLYSFIMALTMLSLYMLFAFMVKSTGATIGICVPFLLFGVEIIQLLTLIHETVEKVLSFTPFGQMALLGGMYLTDKVDCTKFIGVCAVWFLVFTSLSYLSFRKAELK